MQYNPSLDGLRAVAVTMVVALHSELLPSGYFGVDLFFVLSGFLITYLVLDAIREGNFSLRAFYIRRVRRLTPALAVMLSLYLVTAPLMWDEPIRDHVRDSLIAGAYLSDYAVAFWGIPTKISHTWSLAVEEHFYIVWPVLLIALASRSDKKLTVTLLLLFVLATVWRRHLVLTGHEFTEIYYRFDSHCSGLIAGGIAACVARAFPDVKASGPYLAIFAAVYLAWSLPSLRWLDINNMYLPQTMIEIAAAILVVSLHLAPACDLSKVLGWRPLAYLGKLSYGVYLYHYPLSLLFRDAGFTGMYAFAMLMAISTALAAASYHTVEKHFRSPPTPKPLHNNLLRSD